MGLREERHGGTGERGNEGTRESNEDESRGKIITFRTRRTKEYLYLTAKIMAAGFR